MIGCYDCCWTRLNGVVIEILNSADNVVWTKTVETFPRSDGVSWDLSGENIVGSEVRVRLTKQESLSLTEVQVIGTYIYSTSAPSVSPTESFAPTTSARRFLTKLENFEDVSGSEKDEIVEDLKSLLEDLV